MEATCSESQYDQIENHHKGGEGKTEGEADGEGKDKGNLELCYYETLENPSHGAKMYYFMLLREAAQYQFCSFPNYCSKGLQISKGLLDIRFTSNWHKIDIKRLFKGRIV